MVIGFFIYRYIASVTIVVDLAASNSIYRHTKPTLNCGKCGMLIQGLPNSSIATQKPISDKRNLPQSG